MPNSGRLRYANPRDLPSFPSSGLRPDGAAAGAAASLGWSNQKPIEPWRPDKSSSASAAAVLAKDYKIAPAWEPSSNSACTKAALLAVGAAGAAGSSNKSPAPRNPQETWGNSAATQAFNSDRSNSLRQASPVKETPQPGGRSLAAAKGAMLVSRPRASSTPVAPQTTESYPGESKAAFNALSGAALAHKASMRAKSPLSDTGAVPVTTMTRNMFTSHPPVKLEVDEQQNNDKLHASAVAMAKKMYMQQQKMVDQTKDAHSGEGDNTQSKPYVNLQDAAFKQAQERLAKLQGEHQKNRDFQDYYGNASSPRRRFSLGSKLRRRSSSDSDLDRQQSEKIRQQMSMFSSQLSEVDQKKRQQDRDALMAAAQRNVKAQLQGMDQKVYNETGKVNPTMLSEWEVKAHQAAQSNHDTRSEHKGKIDIGGGRFMNPSEVDLIASKRVQPVLDDINEKAEAERERQAVLKMEEETRKAEHEKYKTRERETKKIHRKLRGKLISRRFLFQKMEMYSRVLEQEKEDEKARKLQEKQEEKAKKDEEKAAKAEQKRLAKEEKRRSKQTPATVGDVEGRDTDAEEDHHEEEHHDTQNLNNQPTPATLETEESPADHEQNKPPEGSSPTAKVRGWIRNRFSRKSEGEHDKGKSFMGGAALRGSETNHSTTSLDNRAASMRDVALAGKSTNEAIDSDDRHELRDSRGVSPVSTHDDARSSRSQRDVAVTPPRPIEDPVARTSSSPTRDSRFREMMDQ